MNRQTMIRRRDPAEAASDAIVRAYRGLIDSTTLLIHRAEARGVHWNRSSKSKWENSRFAVGAIKSDWTSGLAAERYVVHLDELAQDRTSTVGYLITCSPGTFCSYLRTIRAPLKNWDRASWSCSAATDVT